MKTGRGFTLVELMIVVAIIGILAVVAMPLFSRYIKKTRTAEAKAQMHKMWVGSVAYYESDHADSSNLITPKQFPVVLCQEAGDCCAGPGGRCPGNDPCYASDAGWIALNFNLAEPHNYVPSYTQSGTGAAAMFSAATQGDLDCDDVSSLFLRSGNVNASSGDVQGVGAPYIANELE